MGDGVDSDINAVSANNVCIPVTLLCVYTWLWFCVFVFVFMKFVQDAVSVPYSDTDPFAMINSDLSVDLGGDYPGENHAEAMIVDNSFASLPLTQENLNLHDNLAGITASTIAGVNVMNNHSVPGKLHDCNNYLSFLTCYCRVNDK